MAELFERSGRMNTSSSLLFNLLAHGEHGTFIETFVTWSMTRGLEEKKRSADPVIKPKIIFRFLVNIWEESVKMEVRDLRRRGVEERA